MTHKFGDSPSKTGWALCFSHLVRNVHTLTGEQARSRVGAAQLWAGLYSQPLAPPLTGRTRLHLPKDLPLGPPPQHLNLVKPSLLAPATQDPGGSNVCMRDGVKCNTCIPYAFSWSPSSSASYPSSCSWT